MMPTAAAVRASQLQYEREHLRQLQREQQLQGGSQGQAHPFLALPGGMSMRYVCVCMVSWCVGACEYVVVRVRVWLCLCVRGGANVYMHERVAAAG